MSGLTSVCLGLVLPKDCHKLSTSSEVCARTLVPRQMEYSSNQGIVSSSDDHFLSIF